MAKPKRAWTKNPASSANEYPYDSASIAYDSTRTYDGVVTGEPKSTTKKPRTWVKA